MNRSLRHSLLLKLSKLQCVDNGDLVETFRVVTEALTAGLAIERASIWFYSDGEKSIVCKDLFEAGPSKHSSGLELFSKDFPAYFAFLAEERTLPADDAHTHPATKEFTEVYLTPLNIFSMLEAPIRLNGKTIGVVCNESVGKKRLWTINDEMFAGNVSDIISRALQARERMLALRKLEEMNEKLEELVEERTKQLEEQRARTAYSSKMASLGEMAGSIAHEINNPLAIILGLSYEARKRMELNTLDPESLKRIVTNVEETSHRIEKIVKGMKLFVREGNREEKSHALVRSVVDDTVAVCQNKLKLNNVILELNIPDELQIYCNSTSVSLVLLNLLSNAIDAVEESEVKLIKISADSGHNEVSIRVTDSGRGILPELREKIMQPFFTTKAVGKGTGLGLSIARGIIEQHNGSIDLDTKSPQTSFVMRFPNK